MRIKFKNFDESELDLTVFRYLTMQKFVSMFSINALWFCKLNALKDKFEGAFPFQIMVRLKEEIQRINGQTTWPSGNVESGQEMYAVSCWAIGPEESERMWREYVGSPYGMAIKTTIRKLIQHVHVWPEQSFIGKVQYVDFDNHTMDHYEAHQAHNRAFIKDAAKYSHENELRIVTMNFKHPNCVKPDGQNYSYAECSGVNMNNFENPGLNIRINTKDLVDTIILAPNSPKELEQTVREDFELNGVKIPIARSKLEFNV